MPQVRVDAAIYQRLKFVADYTGEPLSKVASRLLASVLCAEESEMYKRFQKREKALHRKP